MTRDPAEIDEATEIFLNLLLQFVDGKTDDEVIFPDVAFRIVAAHMPALHDFEVPDIDPCTAGEFRRRYREALGKIAAGEGPSHRRSHP